VAEVQGRWLALLTFSGAAPHPKAREQKIRWPPRPRARRLNWVVNNSRFRVLAERQRYPNLASRVLALGLKRLNADWQAHWGHPGRLVESYVDESQYRGTCYRACGFEAVGLTAGYGRASRDYYLAHGPPKQLYLRELRPRAMALLRQGRRPASLLEHEEKISGPCPLRATELGSRLEVFEQFKDPRRGHGLRHRQPFVLACAAVATRMGAGGYEAFEDECGKLTQRQLRALGCRPAPKTGRSRPPSDTTFFRVLNRLDAAEFDLRLGQWLMAQEIAILQSLAVDGKCLRGSGRTDGPPLQLLSAVSHRLRLRVAQPPLEDKSNEIPALKPLLEKLPHGALAGSRITAEALPGQPETARCLPPELGAEDRFGLPGNPHGVLERAQTRLPPDFFPLNTTPAGAKNPDGWGAGAFNESASVPKQPGGAAAGRGWPCGARAKRCAGVKSSRKPRHTASTVPAPPPANLLPNRCWTSFEVTGRPLKTGRTTAGMSAWAKTPRASAGAPAPPSWPRCGIYSWGCLHCSSIAAKPRRAPSPAGGAS
jgi:hypothetical protein